MAGEREEAETRWYLYVVSFGEPVNPRRGTSLTEREGDRGISLVISYFFLSNVGFVDRLERERRMKIRTKISRKFKKV